jgi:hypothetical protein
MKQPAQRTVNACIVSSGIVKTGESLLTPNAHDWQTVLTSFIPVALTDVQPNGNSLT